MDLTLLGKLAEYGAGLVIAGITLLWKRADDREHAETIRKLNEDACRREDRLASALEGNTAAMGQTAAALLMIKTAIEGVSSIKELEKKVQELNENIKDRKHE